MKKPFNNIKRIIPLPYKDGVYYPDKESRAAAKKELVNSRIQNTILDYGKKDENNETYLETIDQLKIKNYDKNLPLTNQFFTKVLNAGRVMGERMIQKIIPAIKELEIFYANHPDNNKSFFSEIYAAHDVLKEEIKILRSYPSSNNLKFNLEGSITQKEETHHGTNETSEPPILILSEKELLEEIKNSPIRDYQKSLNFEERILRREINYDIGTILALIKQKDVDIGNFSDVAEIEKNKSFMELLSIAYNYLSNVLKEEYDINKVSSNLKLDNYQDLVTEIQNSDFNKIFTELDLNNSDYKVYTNNDKYPYPSLFGLINLLGNEQYKKYLNKFIEENQPENQVLETSEQFAKNRLSYVDVTNQETQPSKRSLDLAELYFDESSDKERVAEYLDEVSNIYNQKIESIERNINIDFYDLQSMYAYSETWKLWDLLKQQKSFNEENYYENSEQYSKVNLFNTSAKMQKKNEVVNKLEEIANRHIGWEFHEMIKNGKLKFSAIKLDLTNYNFDSNLLHSFEYSEIGKLLTQTT